MNLQKIYQDLAFVSSVIPNGQQLFYQGYVNGISGQTAIKVKSQGSDPITVIKIGGSGGYLSDINPSPSGLMDAKCIGAIDFGSNNILSTSLGTYHSNYYNHGCIIIGDSNSGCFLDYELYDWGNAAQKSIVIGNNNILTDMYYGNAVPVGASISKVISIGSNNKLAVVVPGYNQWMVPITIQPAFNNSLIIGSNITINSNGTVWGIEDDENLPKFVLGDGHDFKVNHLIQSVQGKYFDDSALLSGVDYQLVVGNGTSGNLSNIYTRDFNGNIWTAGNISGNNLINTKKLQNGLDCQAIGVGSHAEGRGTSACFEYQHVEGTYNEPFSGAFIIGGGSGKTDTKNIFTVDWNGNTWQEGIISAAHFYDTTNNKFIGGSDGNYLSAVNPSITGRVYLTDDESGDTQSFKYGDDGYFQFTAGIGATELVIAGNSQFNGNVDVDGDIKSNNQYLNARSTSIIVNSTTAAAVPINYNTADFFNITTAMACNFNVINIPKACAIVARVYVSENVNITFGGNTIISTSGIYYCTFVNPSGTIEMVGPAISL